LGFLKELLEHHKHETPSDDVNNSVHKNFVWLFPDYCLVAGEFN